MRLILDVESGPDAPRSVEVAPGAADAVVGRVPPAQVLLAADGTVSRRHAALSFDGRTCRVRDLGSTHGTLVNGSPVVEASLAEGDAIQLGTTVLRVRYVDDRARQAPPTPTLPAAPAATPNAPTLIEPPFEALVIARLRRRPGGLFAVLDAARDPLVLARLLHGPARHQSLYDGLKGDQLAGVAPYLVALAPGDGFLELLVGDGWGKSWGIYLSCDRPFEEVRKHLRRHLRVETEDGRTLLFRFYDPRVLRAFLPTCTPEELREFAGPIRAFLVEGPEPGELIEFEPESGRAERLRLGAPT